MGLLRIVSFRPFPSAAVLEALGTVETVTVLDRADSPGGAPPLYAEVAATLYGSGCELHGAVYGLGGLVAPFVGIKIIDLLVQFIPGI